MRQRPVDATSGLSLVISGLGGLDRVALPEKPRVVLGRAPECDVVVSDASVSRQHAALISQGGLFLEDLKSRNGTRVVGKQLLAGERVPITLGMVIELGSVTIVLERRRAEVEEPPPRSRRSPGTSNRVVADPAMKRLYAMLDVIAPSPLSVIILGETGTGKEVFAEALHARSARSGEPFLPINCAAIAESILESELFGYEKGAFTGATTPKPGLFEAAHGGTVFLDEIGELPALTQAKLLRVLESGEVTRLGSVKPKRVDVRFVSATNRDLAALVQEGRFRSDLYFRLNGYSLTLPPLRQRRADILPLARLFCERAAKRSNRAAPRFSEQATTALMAYGWPGNVRELRNVVERAVTLCEGGGIIEANHLMLPVPASVPAPAEWPEPRISTTDLDMTGTNVTMPPTASDAGDLRATVSSFERDRVLEALRKTSGNQTEAAKVLGISRRTLINKLDAYGIGRPRKHGKKPDDDDE